MAAYLHSANGTKTKFKQFFPQAILFFLGVPVITDVKLPVQEGSSLTFSTLLIFQGLETAVWGVLKAKMQMLEEPAGFLMHFYHLSEILTPVLAWGFLGSDEELKEACAVFKVK